MILTKYGAVATASRTRKNPHTGPDVCWNGRCRRKYCIQDFVGVSDEILLKDIVT